MICDVEIMFMLSIDIKTSIDCFVFFFQLTYLGKILFEG